MAEEMKISITKNGMKIDANGFVGKLCLTELKELEKYLESIGIDFKIAEQALKSESYQTSTQTTNTRKY
jgi:hypothetical protein